MGNRPPTRPFDGVLLFGTWMPASRPRSFCFDVAPHLGDAPEIGLAGQVMILERQCLEVQRGTAGRHDFVLLPRHVARSLMRPIRDR